MPSNIYISHNLVFFNLKVYFYVIYRTPQMVAKGDVEHKRHKYSAQMLLSLFHSRDGAMEQQWEWGEMSPCFWQTSLVLLNDLLKGKLH